MKTENQNLIISVVGKSGSGKTSILNNTDYKNYINFTSRNPRGDESDNDYIFVSKEEFERKINNNELIQYINFNGNYYGIGEVSGTCGVIVVPEGAKQFKRFAQQNGYKYISVYIDIDEETREKRIGKERAERDENTNFLEFRDNEADYIIDNSNDFEEAVRKFKNIVESNK